MFGREIPPFQILTIQMCVIVLAIGIHEFCHAWFADMAGDDTPRLMGRVTLNPLAHLDPLGTLMMLITIIGGYGLGWGKPVMVRPEKMKNPRWDHFISVIAGPLSNLLQAVIYAILLRLVSGLPSGDALVHGNIQNVQELIGVISLFGIMVNASLFIFNLVPLGPLDGHWLVGAMLPERERIAWYKFNHGPGMFVFLALVLIPAGPWDILGNTIRPAIGFVIRNLTGLPF